MSYIFISKIRIPEKSVEKLLSNKVLVFEPEPDFLDLLGHVLARENYEVKKFLNLENIDIITKEYKPEILIISTKFLKHPKFMDFRQNPDFAQIKLISIGDSLEHEEIKNVLNKGFSGHLDRKYSNPQDLVKLVNCLINLK